MILSWQKENAATSPSDPTGCPFVGGAVRLGAIFHHLDAPLARQRKDAIHFTGPSRQVHCNDCFGAASILANGFGSNVLALAVHIRNDRTGANHNRATSGSDEGQLVVITSSPGPIPRACKAIPARRYRLPVRLHVSTGKGRKFLEQAALLARPIINFAVRLHQRSLQSHLAQNTARISQSWYWVGPRYSFLLHFPISFWIQSFITVNRLIPLLRPIRAGKHPMSSQRETHQHYLVAE